ncbi:MAG TPA: metallophosphoesterase, partial [Sphingomicrobium sp.]|nr:metallophosphoesterase [Sphingomicrobium sp.]
RTEQFKEACRFLEQLREAGHEVLGVPGNHDIPLYDVLRRFLSPLTRYRRFIDETLCPFIEIDGVAVLGINTARSFTFTDGRLSEEQVEFIRETFLRADPDDTRVLVTHHPLFAIPVGEGVERAVARHELALDAIEEAGIDLLLAGHAHHASVHSAADLVTRAGGALVIQAGTATSTRLREQSQSFNVIDIENGYVTLTVECWSETRFEPGDAQKYEYHEGRWRILEAEEPAH